ncbi:MAG: 4-hydroxy-tetrahydrodipicolinate synthase [Anaerotardibacter sp.]
MSSTEPLFGRLIPAMVTPFDDNLVLDLNRTQELADRLVKGGVDSLVVCGTTGESPTVFYPQKIDLFKAVIEAVDGRAKIIANVGDNCTDDSVSFAKDVAKLDVDGFLAVVPYYNKPPQEGLYRHYSTLASATDVPLIMYNIPGRCVVNMTAETTIRLANDCDTIVGVKECSGSMEQVRTIVENTPDDFVLYSGDDGATLDIMENGGVGVISVVANVCPERMGEIVRLAADGQWEKARKLNEELLPLMDGLFETANPILCKEALKLLGFPVGGCRLPLISATEEQSARLAEIMKQVGVL